MNDHAGIPIATSDDLTAALWAQLPQVSCASLVDAMGREHDHRAHLLPLVSPDPSRPLFGPAATITFLPHREDAADRLEFADAFYQAVGPRPQGLVLVMSSGGYPEVSHAGGTKLSRLENHGLAGVVCDGRLRDFAQLATYSFSTWCRAEATRWGGDTVMPCATGQPVALDGVYVKPGDYVYIDASGGVVIPAHDVQHVFAEARRIEVDDERSVERIRAERSTDPVHGET